MTAKMAILAAHWAQLEHFGIQKDNNPKLKTYFHCTGSERYYPAHWDLYVMRYVT